MNKSNTKGLTKSEATILAIVAILLFCWTSVSEYESDKQNDEDLEEFVYEQVYLNSQFE